MRDLSFDLDLYFNRVEGAKEIELSLLRPTRIDEESTRRAWDFMARASQREVPKRDPIKIEKNDDGTFTILDGNSTFAVALACGWPRILALEFHPQLPVATIVGDVN